MICKDCEDKGHYWFAPEYEDMKAYEFGETMDELEKTIGIYAYCDMRRVYDTRTGCECGCHKKEVK